MVGYIVVAMALIFIGVVVYMKLTKKPKLDPYTEYLNKWEFSVDRYILNDKGVKVAEVRFNGIDWDYTVFKHVSLNPSPVYGIKPSRETAQLKVYLILKNGSWFE